MDLAVSKRCRAGRLLLAWLTVMGVSPWVVLEAPPPVAAATLGLQVNSPSAYAGYTLISPLRSTATYLVDMEGRVVHQWQSQYTSGQDAYLLENGHLLRSAHLADNEILFAGLSQGGRIQEFTWDGELVWDFKFHDQRRLRHHAITRLPNGNIMMIVWERKTTDDSIAAGVNPAFAHGEILVDSLVEIRPQGKRGGQVVWEWHLWDHLVQDHDPSKANYGDVAAHPERVDANFARSSGGFFGNIARTMFAIAGAASPAETVESKPDPKQTDAAVKQLRGLGYVGTPQQSRRGPIIPIADWTHVNGVAYNPTLDQIMISPREFSEVWILDHSTTTAEAAGQRGGRAGRGGDLLYRWGNPQTYRAGGKADQQLFWQHDTHWIPAGLPGAGHILVFNNGSGRPGGSFSSVDELVPPVDAAGVYARDGQTFGPRETAWSYSAARPADLFAPFMSGAQRLPNGNTLVCTGFSGELWEVTPSREIVWRYIVPDDTLPPANAPPGTSPADRPPPAGGAPAFNFGGVPGCAAVFRAYRYGADYSGLAGRDLTPGKPLVEIAP